MPSLLPAPELRSHIDRYAASHQTPANQTLHFLGIPCLAVASLGLLARLPLPGGADATEAALAGAGGWYLRQDRKLGLATWAALVGCYALGRNLPTRLLATLFGVGVAAHAVGHYGYEGKPPAVFSDPAALLEAPAWLLARWAGPGR